VHDGGAESGHYYSFIYDRERNLWWRFNDHRVSVEKEEIVMKEAFGG
jgi:ubiquitin carboxyl-terminal hydrolase 25/28